MTVLRLRTFRIHRFHRISQFDEDYETSIKSVFFIILTSAAHRQWFSVNAVSNARLEQVGTHARRHGLHWRRSNSAWQNLGLTTLLAEITATNCAGSKTSVAG